MGQALYRKYRPRSFNDAVGQEAATKTLEKAIKSGRISHAYLFAGPRGVGKTSIARILAHQINDLPYSGDEFHLDIIEIDAASNRRIDEIRDLREKVHIAPTSAKFKVYIIDEVHMLTKEAFNALLKTLEEPPAHCIFILATTEAHKLPETIVSRTQRFDFKPISRHAAQERLRKIADEEKIAADDDALEMIAQFGEGSLRDIIGLLDQLGGSGQKISQKAVRDFLGIPADQSVTALMDAIIKANAKNAIGILDDLQAKATDPIAVAKSLSAKLRHKLINNELGGKWAADLLKELIEIPAGVNPQELLELAVLRAAARGNDDQPSQPPTTGEGTQKTNPKIIKANDPPVRNGSSNDTSKESAKPAANNEFDIRSWDEILARAKTKAPSLYSALRLAKPVLEDGKLILSFPFQLHKKKVQEAKQLNLTAEIIEEVTGAKPVILCSLDKSLADNSEPLPQLNETVAAELNAISNIFGKAEVLES
ncbi:MAG TPA: DNA polymerase III subunit gamma/tau [Candidatus Saccharimonadales bacterium]|nr:DNA polymerase III subunit gamma/tau [Candidatus Saccharimonadales bacterium]